MGRFLTPDPYKANNDKSDESPDDPYQASTEGPGDPSNPQSWNRYAYVEGDPVNFYDPTGEFAACPPGTHAENNTCVPDSNSDKLPTQSQPKPKQGTGEHQAGWVPEGGGGWGLMGQGANILRSAGDRASHDL